MQPVPLNVHSQYSILDSTASPSALALQAKEYGLDALALTDRGNLYGLIDFYKACQSSKIKPILGCEIWMAPFSRKDKKREFGIPNGFPIVLLAKNRIGYHNLAKLSSIGFLEGFYYQPRIDKEVLSEHREGLLCLSGSVFGPLGYAILKDREKDLAVELDFYQNLFGEDFYFELQRHPFSESDLREKGISENWLVQKFQEYSKNQRTVEEKLVALSRERGISLVATNDIHYIGKDDWRAHEILLNIQSAEPCEIWERDSRGNVKGKVPNPKRDTMSSYEHYFKSPEEMRDLFADLPEALEMTRKIAEKCTVELDFKTKHYPVFVPPTLEGKKFTKKERLQAAEDFLKELALNAIDTRYTSSELKYVEQNYPGQDPKEVVKKRLEMEFHILSSKGMCDYVLIVYDFIDWAKKKGIPMGPGRGSAAGSILSYLIGITDIEPLRFHLLFERFINPERISYPDIDVDICMERRGEVIDYVISKYGKEKVAQIITFGTMKAKMAIRDVGRVLNVPLSKVNKIAALVPEDPNMTLEKAEKIDPEILELMEKDPEAKAVLSMAKKAEGSIRNTSTHAAGLIISANSITDHIPVCTAKDSEMVVTQYAMKPVESVGMLKIDFLGLKTLTSIQKCVEQIAENKGQIVDWAKLPLDDQKTFDLLNQGKTLGVFQLESGGMQELSKQLHIDKFEEIIAVGALYRPGPMDMIPSFINRKHGREEFQIDHPLMKEILEETYGVMVYQEQVMQIASVLAGYSLGEGDVLRRAMGKKDREEMARQRQKFIEGAKNRGIDSSTAETIFDKIEKFASYGFNKSHAAAYAYLSYATAYFKANHPKEWMAALMTCDRDDTGKLAKFIGEAKAMQIAVLPPDVNLAKEMFVATEAGIRFAMTGVKGVGEAAVEAILEERAKRGPFKSLYDFIQRIDKARVGKKQIELLIAAGGFDFASWSREEMLLSVEAMFEEAVSAEKEKSLGVLNFFDILEGDKKSFQTPPTIENKLSKNEILQREKELLGFYLTGHPMESYQNILARLSCVPFKEIETYPEGFLRAAFVVEAMQVKVSLKSQKKFAILTISDGLERLELPVWPDLFEEKGDLLGENRLLYAILQVERREGSLHLSCRHLEDLTQIDEEKVRASDALYESLKVQRKNWKKEKKERPVEKKSEELQLKINADRIKLSQILSLKELFRSFPGPSPITIQFFKNNQSLGTVAIDATWGVDRTKEFEEQLKSLSDKIDFKVVF